MDFWGPKRPQDESFDDDVLHISNSFSLHANIWIRDLRISFLLLSDLNCHFKLTSAPETASYPEANFYLPFNSFVIKDRNFLGSSSFLCKCLSPVDVIGDTSWSIWENSLLIFITHNLPHSHFKNQLTLVRTGWIVTHLTYLTILVSLWCWFFVIPGIARSYELYFSYVLRLYQNVVFRCDLRCSSDFWRALQWNKTTKT